MMIAVKMDCGAGWRCTDIDMVREFYAIHMNVCEICNPSKKLTDCGRLKYGVPSQHGKRRVRDEKDS